MALFFLLHVILKSLSSRCSFTLQVRYLTSAGFEQVVTTQMQSCARWIGQQRFFTDSKGMSQSWIQQVGCPIVTQSVTVDRIKAEPIK